MQYIWWLITASIIVQLMSLIIILTRFYSNLVILYMLLYNMLLWLKTWFCLYRNAKIDFAKWNIFHRRACKWNHAAHAASPWLCKVLPHCERCCINAFFFIVGYRSYCTYSPGHRIDKAPFDTVRAHHWACLLGLLGWLVSTDTRQVPPTRGERLCMHRGLSEQR